MYTEQAGYGTNFEQNRHGTDMDTTGTEAYLDDVHLPHGYSHYISTSAPQTNSLWQGVVEVSSVCEVGC